MNSFAGAWLNRSVEQLFTMHSRSTMRPVSGSRSLTQVPFAPT